MNSNSRDESVHPWPDMESLHVQVQLGPLLHVLRRLQCESKAVSAEAGQLRTAASLTTGSGSRMQQLHHKAQALQQCIDDKLQQVADNCLPFATEPLHACFARFARVVQTANCA